MMAGDWQGLWMKSKSGEFHQEIALKTWCSIRHGTVGELEMSSDEDRKRLRQKHDRAGLELFGWMI